MRLRNMVDLSQYAKKSEILTDTLELPITIDGNGFTIVTGIKTPYIIIPYTCDIIGWKLQISQSGSISIDILSSTLGTTLVTATHTIVGATGIKPFVTTSVSNTGADMSNWTKVRLTKGDILSVDVLSNISATWASLVLDVTRI